MHNDTLITLSDLAAKLPSGRIDNKALSKARAELDELEAAIAKGDPTEIILELADVLYYAAKVLTFVSHITHTRINILLVCAVQKYRMRAKPGNPKDHAAEQAAIRNIIGR